MALIFVNAVAASEGGALTILRQFLSFIDDRNSYHIFVPDSDMTEGLNLQSTVVVHSTDRLKGFSRIFWDYVGLANFAKKHELHPDLIVSLQNTPAGSFGETPQVVYLHQAIPISNQRWSVLNRHERVFWFYQQVYPFFMRGFPSRNRYYVCQAEWMRALYAKLLRVPVDRVKVFFPHSNAPTPVAVAISPVNTGDRFFIYPAQGHRYKNHYLIVDAARWIRNNCPELFNKIRILFTLNAKDNAAIVKYVDDSGVSKTFDFVGTLDHPKLLGIFSYPTCALLFPSRIETVGLPLLEAASHGCPILASNLPYANEVLSGYNGVKFLPSDDPVQWGHAIVALLKDQRSYDKFEGSSKPGWSEFFAFLEGCSAVE